MSTHTSHSNEASGFTLPVILLISVGLMIVGLSLIQSTASVRNSLDFQYQQRINAEAAEAGTIYANYCLSQNGLQQTWGPANSKPNLAQNTDCNGTTLSYSPAYLMQNGTYRTGFSITDLDPDSSDGSLLIPSSGTFQQTRGSTSSIARSSSSVRKQIVISKAYKASVSSSGTSKTCAIVSNELYCWGKNSAGFDGQLGDGTTTDSTSPVKVVQDTGILLGKVIDDLTSAQYHNCALATGKVYCWGKNNTGQLGSPFPSSYSSRPVEVGGALSGKTVTGIGASGDTSCAIADGKLYCWGDNAQGTVGAGTTTTAYTTPTPVASGASDGLPSNYVATKISSSGSRSKNMCAIADGKAYCWGNNDKGQIGNNTSSTTVDVTYPTKVYDTGVLSGKTVTAISQDGYVRGPTDGGANSGGWTHVCAVADGKVYCWGDNTSGQLGTGSSSGSAFTTPQTVVATGVLSGKTVQDVVVGLQHSCVLANSKVYCWGNGSSGQVGDGFNTTRTSPVAVKANVSTDALYNKNVSAIGGGANRGCATADLKAYCWGLNTDGQLGDGTIISKNVPTPSKFLDPKAPVFIF